MLVKAWQQSDLPAVDCQCPLRRIRIDAFPQAPAICQASLWLIQNSTTSIPALNGSSRGLPVERIALTLPERHGAGGVWILSAVLRGVSFQLAIAAWELNAF